MPWAVAAAAVAAGGTIYASNKQSKAAKGANSDPAWVEDAKISALEKATKISEKPYTPYGGQRVASLSGNEREASELARTGSAKGLGYLDQAGSELGKLEDFSGDSVKKYMNPYMESVLQPQIREQNSSYERAKTSLANSKAGAWGGDRAAFAQSELEKNHMQNVSDLTGKTYASGYDQARSAFFQDQDRKVRAAQAYQSLGGDVSKMNTQQIQDLMATGGTERLLAQADLDFDYQQFTENRDWDTKNLEPLLNAISVSKGGVVSTAQKSDPWGQAIGAASTIAGMYFTGNLGNKSAGSATSGGQISPSVVQGTATTDYFNGGVGA